MPSTINKQVGSASANSYVDLTDANAYFDDRLDAGKWNSATDPDRTRALLMAAKLLQFENWLGDRVTMTQALAWPRIGVAKVDGLSGGYWPYSYGYEYFYLTDIYLTTEIPQPVKDAQCELALDLLSGQTTIGGAPQIESFSIDGLNVTLSEAGSGSQDSKATFLISTLVRGNEIVRG